MLSEAITSRDEMQEKLRAEETIRRKLHNQIQELKGNIRVFCRVRPALAHESADENKLAEIKFPDSAAEGREIECVEDKGGSSMGKEIIKNYPFQFDKVNPLNPPQPPSTPSTSLALWRWSKSVDFVGVYSEDCE
jgi:kinesin family member C1